MGEPSTKIDAIMTDMAMWNREANIRHVTIHVPDVQREQVE